ncbi:hypothetical protein A3Q56_02797 [Intoshia linei]|uniref:LRRCT domain-containing protein n=1 Tax=Intoshia linei TaxID=1819745 RepID=A0A177B564_9BILA|nr:hypothetical protein A3Q56_02797 [Intoshia linei]
MLVFILYLYFLYFKIDALECGTDCLIISYENRGIWMNKEIDENFKILGINETDLITIDMKRNNVKILKLQLPFNEMLFTVKNLEINSTIQQASSQVVFKNINEIVFENLKGIDDYLNELNAVRYNNNHYATEWLKIGKFYLADSRNVEIIRFINCSLNDQFFKENLNFLFNVTSLDLSINNIESVLNMLNSSNLNLRKLNLSFNRLSTLLKQDFGSSEFTHLNFSHNRIVQLAPNLFKTMINLEVLDLSFNPIGNLDMASDLFGSKSNLKYLNLEYTHIRTFYECNLFNLKKLTHLVLLNLNHLDCHCSNVWMYWNSAKYTQNVKIEFSKKTTCCALISNSNRIYPQSQLSPTVPSCRTLTLKEWIYVNINTCSFNESEIMDDENTINSMDSQFLINYCNHNQIPLLLHIIAQFWPVKQYTAIPENLQISWNVRWLKKSQIIPEYSNYQLTIYQIKMDTSFDENTISKLSAISIFKSNYLSSNYSLNIVFNEIMLFSSHKGQYNWTNYLNKYSYYICIAMLDNVQDFIIRKCLYHKKFNHPSYLSSIQMPNVLWFALWVFMWVIIALVVIIIFVITLLCVFKKRIPCCVKYFSINAENDIRNLKSESVNLENL